MQQPSLREVNNTELKPHTHAHTRMCTQSELQSWDFDLALSPNSGKKGNTCELIQLNKLEELFKEHLNTSGENKGCEKSTNFSQRNLPDLG